jgi:hypothetical protein
MKGSISPGKDAPSIGSDKSRSAVYVYERDDGRFQIGLTGELGPFESRAFAEAVARKRVPDAAS